jgi:predicted protein tyrosine phosphatase
MNARVQVFGQLELEERIRSNEMICSHLISIGNPAFPWNRPVDTVVPELFKDSFDGVLRLNFHDAELPEHLPPRTRRRLAALNDVRRIIRFVTEHQDRASGFTVHCWNGVSRSPAVALGVLFLLSGDEEAAAKELVMIRPQARPLQRLIRLLDEELGSNLSRYNEIIRERRLITLQQEIDSMTDGSLEELDGIDSHSGSDDVSLR